MLHQVKAQISPDLARFGLVKSERRITSRGVGIHTDEVPTEVQSALSSPRESNAPDTPIPLPGLGAGNLHQLPPDVRARQLAFLLQLAKSVHRDIISSGCYNSKGIITTHRFDISPQVTEYIGFLSPEGRQ